MYGVSKGDGEALIIRKPWPTRGCCTIKKILPCASSERNIITSPRSIVLPLRQIKSVHADTIALNRYHFHKSMFCVAEPTLYCATSTWRPAGSGNAAAAWRRIYSRCM